MSRIGHIAGLAFERLAIAGLAVAALALPALAQAQAPAPPNLPPPETTVQEVTVTARDPVQLLERRPSDTVFGLKKPLLETPRSASLASAETLDRYGVRDVNGLTAVTPGGFTDSYYGVAGALSLRGTLAETYFDGFKRIENRGTYPTPIGAAERIEVVRGPPTPLYGPGKVGGFLNFIPKTARDAGRDGQGFPDAPTGNVEASAGAYGYGKLDATLSAPVKLGTVAGGVSFYVEGENGPGDYQGIDPRHGLIQASVDLDLAPGWRLAFGTMDEHVEGAVQTPGWNRVTQALVDHRRYTTGRDLTLKDLDGNGRLTPNEIGPGGLLTGYFGFTPAVDPRFTLDTGVGTATIGRRDVFTSRRDFSNTDTHTAYVDLTHALGNGDRVSLQGFYDDLLNSRFVSYGFPAKYDAQTEEVRGSYEAKRDLGPLKTDTLAGASFRRYDGRQQESFNGGNIALDRRDLIYGPTATDILDDPFSREPGNIGLTWETDVSSRTLDSGLFAQTDVALGPFDFTGGGRYDVYRVTSHDDGTVVFGAQQGRTYAAHKGDWTWNAGLSVALPYGFRPYVALAKTSALEVSQAGGIAPSLIVGDSWLSTSRLSEAGVKWRLFKDVLTGSFALYRQTRTTLGQGNAVVGQRGEGAELELRLLATKNLSFTFAGDLQRTTVRGPDNSFIVVPPSTAGLTGAQAYGGGYAVYALSQLVPGDYTDTLIPRSVASLYGVYTGDRHAWGQVGATLGATYVGRTTAGVIPGAVRLPDYALVNTSAFYARGPWKITANIDNLFDRLYFTPVADVDSSVAVLPGVGRTWRMAVRRAF